MNTIPSRYEFPLDECDVADKARLRLFRAKRSEWIDWFSADRHSIWNQISGMLWNDTAFRTINEARRLAQEKKEPRSVQNGLVGELLDEGYVATQALAIRRLLDKPATKAERQVISLQRVIDDMRAHRNLITREHYVCYDGLAFDSEPARQRYLAGLTAHTGAHVEIRSVKGLEAWGATNAAHRAFDTLSNATEASQARGDLVDEAIFDRLEARLQSADTRDVLDFTNKFVAHSGDALSRSVSAIQGLSFDKLDACHEAIYGVAYDLYGRVLSEADHAPLPTAQHDILAYMTEPYVSEDVLDTLYAFWNEREKMMEGWRENRMYKSVVSTG